VAPTDIPVLGSVCRHQPMLSNADQPVATSAHITGGCDVDPASAGRHGTGHGRARRTRQMIRLTLSSVPDTEARRLLFVCAFQATDSRETIAAMTVMDAPVVHPTQ
jgi:hypothetical protein